MITENDPVSVDSKNRWQEAIDAWVREQAEKVMKSLNTQPRTLMQMPIV